MQFSLQLGYDGHSQVWKLKNREDLTVIEEVFLDQDYSIEIAPPAIVFDLGANIGVSSVYFAQRWPSARVFAFEPNPRVYDRLCETTSAYKNIECFPFAAGDSDGVLDFGITESSTGSGFYNAGKGLNTISVPVRSLTSLMNHCGVHTINFLKFDIEGAESLLFHDPAILDHIDAFIGEVHPDKMPEPTEDFLCLFRGFHVERRDLPGGQFILQGIRQPLS